LYPIGIFLSQTFHIGKNIFLLKLQLKLIFNVEVVILFVQMCTIIYHFNFLLSQFNQSGHNLISGEILKKKEKEKKMHAAYGRRVDYSRWSQVIDLTGEDEPRPAVPVPRPPPLRSERIKKVSSEGDVEYSVGKTSVDVDYIDIGLQRGKLEKFLNSPYLNLSNPMLRKVR
jgi:hypothetical protein